MEYVPAGGSPHNLGLFNLLNANWANWSIGSYLRGCKERHKILKVLNVIELRVVRDSIGRSSISPNPPPIDKNPNSDEYDNSNDGNNGNEDVVIHKNSNNHFLSDIDTD